MAHASEVEFVSGTRVDIEGKDVYGLKDSSGGPEKSAYAERTPFVSEEEPQSTWYHMGIHTTTVVVGTGVLGLPSAMSQLTWAPGMILLTLGYFGSYYGAMRLIDMHLTREGNGIPQQRLSTYQSLGEHVLSVRKAALFVAPFQYIILVGGAITYLIAASDNINNIYLKYCDDCKDIKLMVWTSANIGLQLLLSFYPSLQSARPISLVATLCSILYVVLAIILSFYVGKQPGIDYDMVASSTAAKIFRIFTGLSTMAFAFGVHQMIPEIQATLRDSPSPVKEGGKGIRVAWIMVLFLYFLMAISGYRAFGSSVDSNILSSISKADNSDGVDALVTVAQVAVVIHVVIAYQVLLFPVYAALERVCARVIPGIYGNRPVATRISLRFGLILFTWFIAILLPFFGNIMSLVGAIANTPLTFVLPCIMFVVFMGSALRKLDKVVCYIIIAIGTVVGVLGTISSMRQIVLDAETYSVFL